MPIYIIALTLSIVLLLLYIILYWRRYAPIKSVAPIKNSISTRKQITTCPGLSVVIITHDSDYVLQHTIDSVASQDYPDFEIIVVNNASTDNTNDVIKRAAKQYPTLLHSTHLPQNRNGILHMTIATTLGVRAARKEWIVLLRPNATPKSPLWLQSIAYAIGLGYDMCIGYNQYYGFDNSAWEKQAIRWHQHLQILNYRAINRGKRKPIEAESSNFAFRKEDFISNGGYGRWLNLPNYHEHLYATTYATSGKTAMLTDPEAQVETMLPPIRELWQTEYQQTRKAYHRLSRPTKWRRRYYTILNFIFILALLALAAGVYWSMYPMPSDNSADFIGSYLYLDSDMLTIPSIPILTPCAVIVFVATALIHLIYKVHRCKQDKKRISLPLVSNISTLLEEDETA